MKRYKRTKREANFHWVRNVRIAILERDGFRCVKCQSARGLEVDHIVSLHNGGEMFRISNLQTLCSKCHAEKTAKENRNYNVPGADEWKQHLERAKFQQHLQD